METATETMPWAAGSPLPDAAGRCVREVGTGAETAPCETSEMGRSAERIVLPGDSGLLAAHQENAGSVSFVGAATVTRETHQGIGAVFAFVLQRVARIGWRESRIFSEARVVALR